MSNVVCLMNVEADRATFTWSEGPASFEPFTLDGMVYKDFKEIAAEAREKLADVVKDYMFDEQGMPNSAFALADAGHELYLAMFQPDAEQARQARQVRKWLEELAQQREVDTLEIVVESPWSLPWNIVYDQKPDKEAFLSDAESTDRWKPFWGLRYNLAGGRKVDPLRRTPLLKDPKVLMVVDPEIRDGLPEEQQKRLAEFAEKHKFSIVHSKDALQEAIAAERPDLLYWLSHAEPDALVLAGEPISPRNMRKLLRQDDDENFGGLAFLNACQTAEGGDSGSFFEAFHSIGFAGMIGTEHQTVDQFANPLGLDFLEAFLERGEPVGSALRKLRGRVPLGLLYGTYCPPDIRVDQGDIQDSLEISQVHTKGIALSAGAAGDEATTRALPPLPRDPYRSLAYYDRQDRALFAGRDDDIERFATYLDDASTRILVLHGESGVGKSSFLHAGVIPYLEEECLGYRFIRQRESDEAAGDQGSVIFIRATNDLFGQLAQALCDFCVQPYEYQTPLGEQVSADLPGVLAELIGDEVNQGVVRALLRGDPSLLGQIMAAISNCLPFTAILVIDQGEEVFTLAQKPEDQLCGREALDMLRRTVGAAGNFKVIFSLRTEYYGRVIDRLRRGLHDTGNIREYLLTDFDEQALIDAIRRPTAREEIAYTSEVPFEKYGFGYAEGVAEEIAHRVIRHTTQRRDSVLPLVQVICAQLYQLARQRDDRTITSDDLQALGGIEGGMRNHAEGLLGELLKGRPLDKRPLQKLFTQLYLQQPDGTLTTALLAEEELQKRWTGSMPFNELLQASCAMRLLKVNVLRIGSDEERRYVSLGHDALAKLAADWDEELSRAARFRKMATVVAGISSVAVVMAVLAGFAFFAKLEAEEQKELAERNFDRAIEAVDTLLTQVGTEALKDVAGVEEVKTTLLKKAQELSKQFEAENPTDEKGRLQTALAHRRVGDAYRVLAGDREKNYWEDAEKEYEKAIRRLQQLTTTYPDQPRYRHELAEAYNWRGELWREANDPETNSKAVDNYLNALHLQEDLVKEFRDDPTYWFELARTHNNLGVVYGNMIRPELVEQAYTLVIAMLDPQWQSQSTDEFGLYLRELRKETPDSVNFQRYLELLGLDRRPAVSTPNLLKSQVLFWSYNNRGLLEDRAFSLRKADLERAIKESAELVKTKPSQDYRLMHAYGHNNLANLLKDQGLIKEAALQNKEAVKLFEELAAATPFIRNELANGYHSRAVVLKKLSSKGGDQKQLREEAAQHYDMAHEGFEKLFKEDQQNAQKIDRLAMSIVNMAELQLALADYAYLEQADRIPELKDHERNFASHEKTAEAVMKLKVLDGANVDPYWHEVAAAITARCVMLAQNDGAPERALQWNVELGRRQLELAIKKGFELTTSDKRFEPLRKLDPDAFMKLLVPADQ